LKRKTWGKDGKSGESSEEKSGEITKPKEKT
jgi:hypothetical protein